MSVTIIDVETRTGWRYFTDSARVIIDRRPYEPRLETTGGYTRHQFQPGATMGPGEAVAKSFVLSNSDRSLESLHRTVDGRKIVVRVGDLDTDGKPPRTLSAYPITFQGRIENCEFEGDLAELRILSRQTAIAEALVTDVRFDGTATSGGAGAGGNVELAGKPEPILLGYAYNFSPPSANPFDGVYQVSRGWSGHSVVFEWVRDRGAEITPGSSHASLSALLGATPTGGQYDWYTGDDGTFIYPGSPAEGVITVAATEGGGRTVAEVAQWLLEQSTEVTVGSVAGVAAMNTAVPGEAGIWIGTEDTTIGTALEEVLRGVGYWVDDLNNLTVSLGYWDAPQAPAQTISAWETLDDIDLLSTSDVGGGAPISQVLIGYRRNYTPLNKSELIDTVATEVASPLSEEYRLARSEVYNALALNPLAQTMRLDTSLKELDDAQRIADHHRDLRATGIDLFRVPLATSRATADIGGAVTITNPRFGLAAALCGVLGRDTTGRTVDGIAVTDFVIWRPTP